MTTNRISNLFKKFVFALIAIAIFLAGRFTAQPVATVEAGPADGVHYMSEPGTYNECVMFCGDQAQIESIVKDWMGSIPSVTPSATITITTTVTNTPTPTKTITTTTTVTNTPTPEKTVTKTPTTPTPKPSDTVTPTPEITVTPEETPIPVVTTEVPGNPGNDKPVGGAGEKEGKGFCAPSEGGEGTKGKSEKGDCDED